MSGEAFSHLVACRPREGHLVSQSMLAKRGLNKLRVRETLSIEVERSGEGKCFLS
jgi:hypothetical protein